MRSENLSGPSHVEVARVCGHWLSAGASDSQRDHVQLELREVKAEEGEESGRLLGGGDG